MPDGFIRPMHYEPFRIDLWTASGSIDRELALVTDLQLAHRAFEAALGLFPGREITLRQVTRLIRSSISPHRGT